MEKDMKDVSEGAKIKAAVLQHSLTIMKTCLVDVSNFDIHCPISFDQAKSKKQVLLDTMAIFFQRSVSCIRTSYNGTFYSFSCMAKQKGDSACRS